MAVDAGNIKKRGLSNGIRPMAVIGKSGFQLVFAVSPQGGSTAKPKLKMAIHPGFKNAGN